MTWSKCISIFFLLTSFKAWSQSANHTLSDSSLSISLHSSADSLISDLQNINSAITNSPCNTGEGMLISNRALNLFLLDKTSYLSHSDDLSYYTNYITFNSADGRLTVTHTLQETKEKDALIKSFFNAGVSVNIAQPYRTNFLQNNISKEAGLILNFKVIGKSKTIYNKCTDKNSEPNQKQTIDAFRALLLKTLTAEIENKSKSFEAGLSNLQQVYPGAVKQSVRQKFYSDLREEYYQRFAQQQAETLTQTKDYKRIKSSWSAISLYVPVASSKYYIASSLNYATGQKRSYLFEAFLSHTRLWETRASGRFFLTIKSSLKMNNSKDAYQMNKMSFTDYRYYDGVDTLMLRNNNADEVYIGNYEKFLTTAFSSRIVYFPNESHVGLACTLEQNLGKFNSMNMQIGVPIIIINSKRLPAINFEFNWLLFDVTHKILPTKNLGDKSSFALHIGIPFSRMIY